MAGFVIGFILGLWIMFSWSMNDDEEDNGS